MRHLPPYFHPSRACCVDDNERFLRSLALAMPRDVPFTTFSMPEPALDYLLEQNAELALADRCFSREGNNIHLSLAVLEQEIKHINRFDRLSVVLVDYAMPTMDGLEFCAAIQHLDVRRVLLTGVADAKTAVEAFNKGLIHHYLPKANISAATGIIPYLRDQQIRYFQQYLNRITRALEARPPEFMQDARFIEYFKQVLEDLHIVEYYLLTEPMGYLLLRGDGEIYHLIVRTETQQAEDLQAMLDYQAPAALIDAVASRGKMTVLYEHPRDYLGHEEFPWEEFVFDAREFHGQKSWLAAVIHHPPTDVDFDAATSSHDEYMRG